MPGNNFFKRHKPKRYSYQRQRGVQVWVLLLLERQDWVFALQEADRKGRRGLGDAVKNE